jgi:hypothetical protein
VVIGKKINFNANYVPYAVHRHGAFIFLGLKSNNKEYRMLDDNYCNNESHQNSDVTTVQGNLLRFLRLLAKEVTHRLVHKPDDRKSPSAAQHKESELTED